jgi:dienelactone hydrolase
MRLVLSVLLIALMLSAPDTLAQGKKAGPVADPTGPIREQVWWVPMAPPRDRNQTLFLETTVYRPPGAGPFPLVVLNHGSPRDAEARRTSPRTRYFEQSQWFVQQGFAVVLPMRRGYANSDGDWAEGYGGCAKADYFNGGFSTANDIGEVMRYFRGQSFVDGKRIVLVGQSAGGWGVLAAASRNPDGVLGVVNFAGGRGSTGTNTVCGEHKLVEAAAQFGKSARIPALWLYAENDLYFGPQLSKQMFEAYTKAGAPAEYVQMQPYGRDGHGTFATWDASNRWVPPVREFLTRVAK